jgi:hypothetical protein
MADDLQPREIPRREELSLEIGRREKELASFKRALPFKYSLSVFASVVAALFLYTRFFHASPTSESVGSSLFLAFFLFAGLYSASKSKMAKMESDLELSRTRKRIVDQLPLPDVNMPASDSYFERLVAINVENLAAYYSLVKTHTNNSFMAALTMGVAGLCFWLQV